MMNDNNQPTEIKQQRRIPLSNIQIILIALIIVGGRLVIDFSQRIIEGQNMLSEQHALEAEIENLREEQRKLEQAKEYYNSAAFVEAWAHSEGKMVREGEKLIVPSYDEANTSAAPALSPPADPIQSLTPWQVWWTLFFDTTPQDPPDLQP